MTANQYRGDRASTERWLQTHRAETRDGRDQLWARETRWSWARLATFLAATAGCLAVDSIVLGGVILLVGMGLFAWTVHRHRATRAEREAADRLLLIIDEALQRCGGRVVLIRSRQRPAEPDESAVPGRPILDDGPTWKLTEQERDDLDFYGEPVGIFGLLNRASSMLGTRRLAEMIEHPCLSSEHILARQQAVRWLDEHPDRRLKMMAAATALRERDGHVDRLITATRAAQELPSPVVGLLMRTWSVVTAGLVICALARMWQGYAEWRTLFWPLIVINGLACLRIRRTLAECLGPWKNAAAGAAAYLLAANRAGHDLPDTTDLHLLRSRLRAAVAPDVLPVLCKRIGWADSGGMIHALFNVLFFWDLHVASAILERVIPNREALLAGLCALADLEALNSLACFAFEQPVRAYPTPGGTRALVIESGMHPLLDPRRAVANDVDLDGSRRMWLVTGSNMSGKSTFLRMIGVNCLLAQLGTTALARKMSWSPMRLVTDLQVRDSLARDESYFLAEVRHLRRMVSPGDAEAGLLGLIDEPFRGTNSREQVAASVALVEHLVASGNLFVVATHAQELTELADEGSLLNYHFQEHLQADDLVFEYRLRPGAAQTRSALRVLEREGYPPGMLDRARGWLADTAGTPRPAEPD